MHDVVHASEEFIVVTLNGRLPLLLQLSMMSLCCCHGFMYESEKLIVITIRVSHQVLAQALPDYNHKKSGARSHLGTKTREVRIVLCTFILLQVHLPSVYAGSV